MLARARLRRSLNSILPVLCRGKKTHFGFATVEEEEKQQRVGPIQIFEITISNIAPIGISAPIYDVFRNVATKYDLMNDAMSFGLHRLWKDAFVRELGPKPGMRILDSAGGTGDIALRISAESRKVDPSRPSEVVVTDINQSMLDVGKEKARQSQATGLSWIRADAEELPFKDDAFDAYTIAFGIRNCTHMEKVLDEALRVLVPGGRFMCLEFSRMQSQLLSPPYDWYSFNVIPVLGRLIANDWTSYRYLVESIRKFPDQESFAKLMRQFGFQSVTWTNLLCGVVAIHSGYKGSTGAQQTLSSSLSEAKS